MVQTAITRVLCWFSSPPLVKVTEICPGREVSTVTRHWLSGWATRRAITSPVQRTEISPPVTLTVWSWAVGCAGGEGCAGGAGLGVPVSAGGATGVGSATGTGIEGCPCVGEGSAAVVGFVVAVGLGFARVFVGTAS